MVLVLLPTALAAPVELALLAGTRDSLVEAAMFEGPRVGARLASSVWEIELAGFVAPRADRLTDGDRIELEVAAAIAGDRFHQVSDVDRLALSLLGSWGPRGDRGWWGGPRLVAGAELRQIERTWRHIEGEAIEISGSDAMWVPGADLGFAFDAHLGSPLGLRLTVLDRIWVGPAPDYEQPLVLGEPRLFQDPTLCLDLSWSFGVGGAP